MRAYLIAVTGLMLATPPAGASPKPCRDAQGRIVTCPKPAPAQHRCKDAQGRYIKCEHPKPQS